MLTIEGMSDGVIVLDARNRIVDLNPAAERITGRTSSQAIGQPATQVIPGRPDLVEPYLEMAAARTEVALGEHETGRCYDLHVSPLRDRGGRLTGRLVVLHDVTEQKQAEAALRESKKKIESLHDLDDRRQFLQGNQRQVRPSGGGPGDPGDRKSATEAGAGMRRCGPLRWG